MKSIIYMSTIVLIGLFFIIGCQPSDEQVKRLIKVGSEIAELQKQYFSAITELGKVAVEIESIAQRQDKTAKLMAKDIAEAHKLISEAFEAGQKIQQESIPVPPNQEIEKYIHASEVSKGLFIIALDKTNAALNKSHAVIEALNKK
jgi:hypothetical protein